MTVGHEEVSYRPRKVLTMGRLSLILVAWMMFGSPQSVSAAPQNWSLHMFYIFTSEYGQSFSATVQDGFTSQEECSRAADQLKKFGGNWRWHLDSRCIQVR